MHKSHATPPQLAAIDPSPRGTSLHWPLLDVDLTVDGLLIGVFGSKNWMRHHLAKAGSASKAAAARADGAKGGKKRGDCAELTGVEYKKAPMKHRHLIHQS